MKENSYISHISSGTSTPSLNKVERQNTVIGRTK